MRLDSQKTTVEVSLFFKFPFLGVSFVPSFFPYPSLAPRPRFLQLAASPLAARSSARSR